MTSSLSRIMNPEGRVDWLVAKCIERGIEQQANPIVKAFFPEVRPLIENLLAKHLGPKNRTMRRIRYAIKAANRAQGRMKP